MPIYEYGCTKCGHRFELIQKVDDPPLKKCEKCKSKVERLVSSPAIQFKGSGWYITDYARKGAPPETKDATSKDSGSKESKDSKDSKKESKKEKSTSKAAAK